VLIVSSAPAGAARQRPVWHGAWANNNLRALSLEEKIGQMIQVRAFADYESFDAPEYRELQNELRKYHIGSVVFGLHVRGANFAKPLPLQVSRVANRLQADSKLPLLIGADLERGLASRMDGVPIFPDQMAFGAVGDANAAYELGQVTAREARAVGINWAFAPVADVNTNPESPIINIRSFGDDPNRVGEFVAAFCSRCAFQRIAGHGETFPRRGECSLRFASDDSEHWSRFKPSTQH
jgi:beta-N-acetylhexosaminidase